MTLFPGYRYRAVPVVHHLLSGELKHYYFRKDGRLAFQKATLTASSDRQRIGYQVLADEAGTAFVDIYLVDETGRPRLEPVCEFLALAWSATVVHDMTERTLGLPEILSVNRNSLTEMELSRLDDLGLELEFEVWPVSKGFGAGANLLKHLNFAFEMELCNPFRRDTDWLAEDGIRFFSSVIATSVSTLLGLEAPLNAFKVFRDRCNPVYTYRPTPTGWFEGVAKSYGKSEEEFKAQCFYYCPETAGHHEAIEKINKAIRQLEKSAEADVGSDIRLLGRRRRSWRRGLRHPRPIR